ncbi:MAG: phosphatase PAP2 family protein [Eubacterium sp.]|nr:phosphatase PAP2 family protein [Eubacterium sp.]
MGLLLTIEGSILLFIQNNIRNEYLTPVMKAVTLTGDFKGLFWIVISTVLLIIKQTRKVGICVAISLAFSGVFTNLIIKNLVSRIRPYEMIDGLTTVIEKPTDTSFPSGHSSLGFAAAVALLLSLSMIVKKKTAYIIGISVLIFVSIVAFSRLYLGVHFPTDVICGALLGIAYGFAGTALGKLLIKKIYREESGQ